MAQTAVEEGTSCVHSPPETSETQHGEKAASVYQTDFSVTNRLLSPYNNGGSSSLSHHQPSVTISYHDDGSCSSHHQPGPQMPGWQSMLPNDQGGVTSKHYPQWRNPAGGVPNSNLPHESACYHQTVGYGATASASYNPTETPDSSTGMGGKENSGIGAPLTEGDKLAIRKFCQQVNNNTKQRGGSSSSAGHDDADDEDSGDESVADSSPLSSHGETESVEEPKKPKRTRTAFSNLQLDQLELAFSRSHYPDVFTREDLSTKLNIKEDRIQVWFQNRRARYRKQERTGSVSLRSKYRQKRLQKLQQTHVAAAATGTGMYAGYYAPAPSQTMLTSPQPVSPYMSGFAFPSSYLQNPWSNSAPATSSGTSMEGTPSTMASPPSYLPGFNAPMKGFPGYVMGLNHNGGPAAYGSAYNSAPTSVITPPVSQK